MKCGKETRESIKLKHDIIGSLVSVDNNPIDISGTCLQNVKLSRYYHMSMDGKQYAKTTKKKSVVLMEIFKIKSDELEHQIEFAFDCNTKYEEIIEFSTEYLIYIKQIFEQQKWDLYLHNFKLNKGKCIQIEKLNFEACYFKSNQFYLLLSNEELHFREIQSRRVDQDFNIHIEKFVNITYYDGIHNPKSECTFDFCICPHELNQLCFLSHQFKPINHIGFKDLSFIDFERLLIIMKNIFIIDEKDTEWVIVCQNRNGKIIRKLNFSAGKYQISKIVIIQNYIFAILFQPGLEIYDLSKGCNVKRVEIYTQLTDIIPVDDYVFFQDNDHNIGVPIKIRR